MFMILRRRHRLHYLRYLGVIILCGVTLHV